MLRMLREQARHDQDDSLSHTRLNQRVKRQQSRHRRPLLALRRQCLNRPRLLCCRRLRVTTMLGGPSPPLFDDQRRRSDPTSPPPCPLPRRRPQRTSQRQRHHHLCRPSGLSPLIHRHHRPPLCTPSLALQCRYRALLPPRPSLVRLHSRHGCPPRSRVRSHPRPPSISCPSCHHRTWRLSCPWCRSRLHPPGSERGQRRAECERRRTMRQRHPPPPPSTPRRGRRLLPVSARPSCRPPRPLPALLLITRTRCRALHSAA